MSTGILHWSFYSVLVLVGPSLQRSASFGGWGLPEWGIMLGISSGLPRYSAFISLHWWPMVRGRSHGLTLSYMDSYSSSTMCQYCLFYWAVYWLLLCYNKTLSNSVLYYCLILHVYAVNHRLLLLLRLQWPPSILRIISPWCIISSPTLNLQLKVLYKTYISPPCRRIAHGLIIRSMRYYLAQFLLDQ